MGAGTGPARPTDNGTDMADLAQRVARSHGRDRSTATSGKFSGEP